MDGAFFFCKFDLAGMFQRSAFPSFLDDRVLKIIRI